MSELDPSAREYVERERAAWRDADTIPTSGADRAWAAAPVRARAIARARLVRILVAVAALTLLGVGLLALPVWQTARTTQPQRSTASDAAVHETPTTEPPVKPDVPIVATPAQAPPPIVTKHETPTTKPRVTAVPGVAAPRPQAVDTRPAESNVGRDAGVATPTDGATEDGLDAEFRLLREARVAIRDGKPERALQICAEHAARFPAGVLTPERRTIERRARCLVAQREGRPTPDECR